MVPYCPPKPAGKRSLNTPKCKTNERIFFFKIIIIKKKAKTNKTPSKPKPKQPPTHLCHFPKETEKSGTTANPPRALGRQHKQTVCHRGCQPGALRAEGQGAAPSTRMLRERSGLPGRPGPRSRPGHGSPARPSPSRG